VISILFEEMLKDLKQGKTIRIANFGSLALQKTKPRWYHNVRQQKMVRSSGNQVLRFFLAPPIRKKLCENVELDSPAKDEHNE
jgi:nucleoid DNA-binding protein